MAINKIRNRVCELSNENDRLQEVLKYIVKDSDKENYSKSSKEIIECKCVDCNTIKYYRMCDLWHNGFSCPRCGDGFSYPAKFMYSFLDQLNVYFDREFHPTWAFGRRYDFYFKLNHKEYVVEMDGAWHFNDNLMSGQTAEETKKIDEEKNKYAADNDVHMIRIDSYESTLEYIKNNIYLSDLNELVDLSAIDWFKCREYTATSMLKYACKLWNENNTVMQISKITKCNIDTIRKYLLRGKELNLCNYSPTNSRPVICLNTKEIFDNGRVAGKKFGIYVGTINANCKGRANSAGKNPDTGENLKWMFYDEYLELSVDEQNNLMTKTIKTSNRSGVVCLNTLKIFKKIAQAGRFYNISDGNITMNAQGKTNYAGKLPDGTPLHWMYYDKYLEKQLEA